MSSKENRREEDPSGGNDNTEGSGKVAQAHNSTGDKPTTQINQGRRTPESRGDRDTHLGSSNQAQSRRGAAGSSGPAGSRGAG
ncbi:hypothetical protein KW843_17135 [Acidovorax sp. sif1233]|uniref:hypothetical protein n=1 Tax=unclassified Acidovorax TaxID=2684926 RepID=UPI001C4454AE|nr:MULTISPECIES: hypothetical protein [unclassified Acidovorax]MBV7429806.1 hypothetical protein [Acidovorax sp. sif0732]MBV7448884.1 hypothetical protein [Acidovorax sp. sif0715]MBV7456207.1 hypothetical protein [Acidovorax sp. sif1233]